MNSGTRPPPEALPDEVTAMIDSTVLEARSSGQTQWLARVIETDVGDCLQRYAEAGTRDRFLWDRGESTDFCVSWGVADEAESTGPDRYRDIRTWMAKVRERIHWLGDTRPGIAGTFFGGFGFEAESRVSAEWKSFPAARFVLPEVIVESRDGVGRFVLIARVEPTATAALVEADLRSRWSEVATKTSRRAQEQEDSRPSVADSTLLAGSPRDWPAGPEFRVSADRSHEIFRAQVRCALREFERGGLSKVVLARSLSVDHDGVIDVPAFLGRLRALYPSCTLVAMGRGQDTFLAATPETLVRVEGREVATAALAGSAPRGRSPEEDRVLADGLLTSTKERREHDHVVSAIRDVLALECESIDVAHEPVLRPLFGIQHLETPIRGCLKASPKNGEASDALALVEALHPTPAVGGVPRHEAAEWQTRFEGLDRGWYAAPIGWLDTEGGGDFSVALRSALIRNGLGAPGTSGASRTHLFAGAGIVEGSEPEQELVETRIKLRALLAPLTEI
jgi:isochorismate synthase